MRSGTDGSINNAIMLIVILAGLACGAIVAWHLTSTKEADLPDPDLQVVEDQQLPWDMLHPEQAVVTPGPGAAPADLSPVEIADDPAAPEAPDGPAEPPADYDAEAARVIRQSDRNSEAAGVTEFVTLDDELFIRVSAKLAIMASTLTEHPDARDVLVDYEAQLLTEERIRADDWYQYAIQVGRDPDRAAIMGEMILREAEKHTDMRINVQDVPEVAPAPVARRDEQ